MGSSSSTTAVANTRSATPISVAGASSSMAEDAGDFGGDAAFPSRFSTFARRTARHGRPASTSRELPPCDILGFVHDPTTGTCPGRRRPRPADNTSRHDELVVMEPVHPNATDQVDRCDHRGRRPGERAHRRTPLRGRGAGSTKPAPMWLDGRRRRDRARTGSHRSPRAGRSL